jgi:hypothetical protein
VADPVPLLDEQAAPDPTAPPIFLFGGCWKPISEAWDGFMEGSAGVALIAEKPATAILATG